MKSERMTELLEIVNNYSRVTGYGVNTQMFISVLYTRMNTWNLKEKAQ